MHREQFDNRQLSGMSEEQYANLSPNGRVMTCIRELAALNRER